MSERYRIGLPVQYEQRERTDVPRWQTAGKALAEFVLTQEHPSIFLDMDGVLMKSDSFDEPKLITPHIIPALQKIESAGIDIGPATARGSHILHFLRDQGLQMKGPGVLEEGHVFIHDGRIERIDSPEHRAFMTALQEAVTTHPYHKHNWDTVKQTPGFSFCRGNEQWKGEGRSSFWYNHHNSSTSDIDVLRDVFHPIIAEIAPRYNLDTSTHIALSQSAMAVDGLTIVSVKGKFPKMHNGIETFEPIHKGIVVEKFMEKPWIFVADGAGDFPLAQITKKKHGFVIGIEGSLDISKEIPAFLNSADVTIADAHEFAQTLNYATYYLSQKNLAA